MCLAKLRRMTEYYERYWGISMKLDLVFVTYNSEKWVAPCLASLARSRYPLQDINIFIHDNASTDKTVALCSDLCEQTYRSVFGNVMIIKSNKNVGFGMGNNLAPRKGKLTSYSFSTSIRSFMQMPWIS
jgi:GT2 family glycosyltransferase